jgi:hypothetical protein
MDGFWIGLGLFFVGVAIDRVGVSALNLVEKIYNDITKEQPNAPK